MGKLTGGLRVAGFPGPLKTQTQLEFSDKAVFPTGFKLSGPSFLNAAQRFRWGFACFRVQNRVFNRTQQFCRPGNSGGRHDDKFVLIGSHYSRQVLDALS